MERKGFSFEAGKGEWETYREDNLVSFPSVTNEQVYKRYNVRLGILLAAMIF